MTWATDTWAGCYDGNWKGIIVPDAYRHPAKFARGLIQRIYKHLLECGYVRPGMTVVDPFGGVALGAVDAMENRLRWVGCELEPHFHKLGNENLALWAKRWGLTGGTLLQGDSRRLCEMLAEAGVCVSSPPYVSGGHHPDQTGAWNKNGRGQGQKEDMAGYGATPGQLGQLPAGDVGAVLSSPPYAETVRGAHGETETAAESRDKRRTPGGSLGQSQRNGGYGVSDGNLSGLPVGGVVSSPPYSESRVSPDGNFVSHKCPDAAPAREAAEGYGVVSSPPYSGSQQVDNREKPASAMSSTWRKRHGEITDGTHPDQLANSTEETFWSASRLIVQQCASILPPGAVACWVVKDFVRDKQRVPFSDQWRQLCEACGFEMVEWIKASLVKETVHATLFEGEQTKRKERKSFFRRLAEKKGSPRIDHEDVLILRRMD